MSLKLTSQPDLSGYQPLDADLTAIAALGFTSTAFLKKTAANTWALDTSTYLTAEADTLQTVMTRGATTATQLVSTLATGTSPFAVTSTTVNTNLNADMLDGKHIATTGSAVPNMASDNTWGGAQTFWAAGPQLTLGRASTTEGKMRLYDAQSANYVDVGVSKLTTAAYTAEHPDHAAGTVNYTYGSGVATYLAYWSNGTDLTGSKNLIVDAANAKLTLGNAGVTGQLALYSEQGATDYTATLKPNAAMTASTAFYFPAAAPGGTRLMTMTSGGVMGFFTGTASRVLFLSATDTVSSDADFTFSTDTLTVTKIAATTYTGTQTYADAVNLVFNATTGSKIGTATTQKLGFWNATPVVQPTAPASLLTTLTFTAPGTPDYALQDVTQTTPWGFADAEELRTFISVVKNLQDVVGDIRTKLQAIGITA